MLASEYQSWISVSSGKMQLFLPDPSRFFAVVMLVLFSQKTDIEPLICATPRRSTPMANARGGKIASDIVQSQIYGIGVD